MSIHYPRFIPQTETVREKSTQLEFDFSVNIDAVKELSNPSNWVVEELLADTVWKLYNSSVNLVCVFTITRMFWLDGRTTENTSVSFCSHSSEIFISDSELCKKMVLQIIKGEL